MTQLERLETKATLVSDEAGIVSGIAWPFGQADSVGDIIEPAGVRFADRVPMLLEHNQKAVVGTWENLAVTTEGIEVKGGLFIEGVAPAREARQTMQRGLMNGLSIGYMLHEAKARPEGGRILKSLTITEISLCQRPIHPAARITEVKSEGTPMTTAAVATPAASEAKAEPAISIEEVKALETRVTAVETALARPAIIGQAANDNEPTAERKAFGSFLRHGPERMQAEETKALIVSDDTRGGYLAPAEFSTEILKGVVEFSPVRQAARVGSTAAGSVILPKRTGTPTAQWVGETEDRSETESSYGQIEIPVHEMAAFVDVSVQLLEDAAVNVESEVASDLAEEFGRLEAVAFVNGNAVKKPEGLMAAAGIAEVVSGSAASIADPDGTADGLINALYSLPATYRARATWMMNGTTLAAVRKLKDSNKSYIWQPGLQAGEPSTILGRPVIEAPDMPDIAAGAFPILLGDFNTSYRIYDRVAMSILRDPYTQATKGKVRFHARRRVGAAVTMAEALRKIKIAAA